MENVLFKEEAQKRLYAGIKEVADAVGETLGPKGHYVMIDKGYGIPHITKDGVTVARAYDTADIFKRMGATLVKTVAAKTVDDAGDGTTTATILTEALVRYGMEKLGSVHNPRDFRQGMEAAKDEAVAYIQSIAKTIDRSDFRRIKEIAMISSNGDKEIGTIIGEAIGKVGNDGVITVEESAKGNETTVEVTAGFQWNKGIVNPYFVTDKERMECVLDRPYVLVVGQNLNYAQEILGIVQSVYSSHRSLLIVAPNASNDVIKFLVTNVAQGNLKACFVKAPGYGQMQKELTEDLAIRLGAKTVGDEWGRPIDQIGTDWLGECERITVAANKTIVIGGAGLEDDIAKRVEAIKHQIAESTNSYDVEKFRERISRLTGGAAVVYVGGDSEVETKERKDRVDDAIAATRAAVEEGYVPGGGTVQLRIAAHLKESGPKDQIDDFVRGWQTVQMAIYEPFQKLCENNGVNPYRVEAELVQPDKSVNFGYNPISQIYADMEEQGIIDPAKVTRVALENAVSVAIQFLTTSCVIMQLENNK